MPVKTCSILAIFVVSLVLSACGPRALSLSTSAPGVRSAASSSPTVTPPPPVWTPGPGWTLSWNESFSGPNALRNWEPVVGGFSAESRELQYFSAKNLKLKPGGGLAITATTNGYGKKCWYGTCRYSSAMISTAGRFQQQYGVFSAYVKIPAERGLWPAFWIAGADSHKVALPYSGEIDIIEVNNKKPDTVEGFVHSPQATRGFYLKLPKSLSASYHEYSVEWAPTGITWLIDGHAYGHVRTKPGASPFNQPFYVILDLAVGGTWPGPPTASTVFPAQLDVAWIHIYKYQKKS